MPIKVTKLLTGMYMTYMMWSLSDDVVVDLNNHYDQ